MIVTILWCWWQNHYVGELWESVTNTSKLSPTYTIFNIHRCRLIARLEWLSTSWEYFIVLKPLLIWQFHCFREKTVGKISLQLEILFLIGKPPSRMKKGRAGWLFRLCWIKLVWVLWDDFFNFCNSESKLCSMCPCCIFQDATILSKWNQIWPSLVSSIYFKGASRWLTYSKYIWNSLKTVHWTLRILYYCILLV